MFDAHLVCPVRTVAAVYYRELRQCRQYLSYRVRVRSLARPLFVLSTRAPYRYHRGLRYGGETFKGEVQYSK
jgi:hypothetical protein